MSIDFVSPSIRSAGSDLTIAISPLGLVELSDEEFEIHGPRLNRYSQSWAFYLGHHWAYRREAGEAQITFNYVRALSDWLTNFTFSNGITFAVPEAYQHTVPALLERVWNKDNDKEQLLWEIGNQGSVQGDAFVKIAYEPGYTDVRGNPHKGIVKILPINASFCFPVDENEILTKRGWLTADELTTEDEALSLNTDTDELVWSSVDRVNIFDWDGPIHDWSSKHFAASSTSDHRWITKDTAHGKRKIRTTADINKLSATSLVLAGGELTHFPKTSPYSDEFVELVGWVATEGWLEGNAVSTSQSWTHNPEFSTRIENIAKYYDDLGFKVNRSKVFDDGHQNWYFPAKLGVLVQEHLTIGKGIRPEFISELTNHQAQLLFDTLLNGDGDTRRAKGRERLYQSTWPLMDSFQMLAMMLGKKSTAKLTPAKRNKFGGYDGTVAVHQSATVNTKWLNKSERHYKGRVWCPTTSTGTWVTRRKEVGIHSGTFSKQVYLTGNCFPEW